MPYSPDSGTWQTLNEIESKNIKKPFHQNLSKRRAMGTGSLWNFSPGVFPQKTSLQAQTGTSQFQTPDSLKHHRAFWARNESRMSLVGNERALTALPVNHSGPELAVKRQTSGHGGRSFSGLKPTSSQLELQGQSQVRVTFLFLFKPRMKAHRMRNSLLLGRCLPLLQADTDILLLLHQPANHPFSFAPDGFSPHRQSTGKNTQH